MAPRSDGAELVWAVRRFARGWVECRCPDGRLIEFRSDAFGHVPCGDDFIRVRLAGLAAGSLYRVRAVTQFSASERVFSDWKSFRTLDLTATSTKFVVWNDTHDRPDTIRYLNKITPDADFLIWNGDTCNDWHRKEQLIPTLLNPAGCDISAGRPLMLVWGNHDVRGEWAHCVSDLIATPEGKPYYAFRSGPVGVICLHTGEDKPDDHASFRGRVAFDPLRREQADWLEKVIEAPGIRDAPFRLVFCHLPLRWIDEPEVNYGAGGYDWFSKRSRDLWHKSLVKWKAQVVISGHTHQDAWLPANEEFPYAQMVSGGPRIENARWIEGVADSSELHLVMRDLDGKVCRTQTLSAL
ncbi:MAG: metallophosphoesterase family protein [Luteolibacter sp.]